MSVADIYIYIKFIYISENRKSENSHNNGTFLSACDTDAYFENINISEILLLCIAPVIL